MSLDASYLARRIEDLDAWWRRTHGDAAKKRPAAEDWQRRDACDVALQVAQHVRESVDLVGLEQRLASDVALDLEPLKEATAILKAADYDLVFATGARFEPAKRLESLEHLASLEPEKLDPLEVLLRLSFWGDSPIDALLTGAKDVNAVRAHLEPLVLRKLGLLRPPAALDLLQQYVAETDPARNTSIAVPEETREALNSADNAEDVRTKIAGYLLHDRPLAVRQVLQTKPSASFPMVSVGVARVLTWPERKPDSTPLSAAERDLVKNLGRLAIVWARFLGRDASELADSLGLGSDALLLTGDSKRAARSRGGADAAPDWSTWWYVLRVLVEGLQLRDVPRSIQALWAYKQGLEVMLPESRDRILGLGERKEIPLQQELCRFLVERGIPAYGKSFGRGQIDLRAEDAFGTLIIETKVLTDPPTDTHVRHWLSQLLAYMNQEPANHRGALVLFNTTNVSIVTKDRALLVKQRLYVVSINLCGATPSKRVDAIEIVESDDPGAFIRLRRPIEERV